MGKNIRHFVRDSWLTASYYTGLSQLYHALVGRKRGIISVSYTHLDVYKRQVISNESGAGGAKLFHRGVGENIRRLCTVFPHWYAANFKKYMDKDTLLPFDQHQVISLVAPRPVYIASAVDDKGADQQGEFSAAKAAESVSLFLGKTGLPAQTIPPLNQWVQGQIGYHVRTVGHDVTLYDWKQYLSLIHI